MKINSITTHDGQNFDIGKLTVLVGPNNTGKSRTLLDISSIFQSGYVAKTTLVKKLLFEKITYDEFKNGLKMEPASDNPNNIAYSGLNPSLTGATSHSVGQDGLKMWIENLNENWQNICGVGLGQLKITHLNADLRLQIAKRTIPRGQPELPLQDLYEKEYIENLLADAFMKAFGMEIKLDLSVPGELKLKVSEKFEEIPENPRKARPLMEKYPILDDQGDGFKSFVGIILGIILSEGRIILIDEPEAFLHPTQARVLGEWIAKYSKSNVQIIVATHSTDILNGILNGNDITILRLNRKGNSTNYRIISPTISSQLAKMPLLSSQPVLEAIFYRGVIVCEGDSDRVIYESVYSTENDKREFLFVDAFGKQAVKKIVKILKGANIPVCSIVDMDILNDETEFKELLDVFQPDIDHSTLLETRKKIAKSVEGVEENNIILRMKGDVEIFLEKISNGKYALNEARGALEKIREGTSKWKDVKRNGIDGIPESSREDAKRIIDEVKKFGLFITPVGELESWIEVGPKRWILNALTMIHDEKTPLPLKEFVINVVKFLEIN